MKNKESYGNFIESLRSGSSEVAMPEGFTHNVMNRIVTFDSGLGQSGAGRSKVIMRWKFAASCISSAAAVLLLLGLFSVSVQEKSAGKSSTESVSQKIPVLSFEEKIEIYSNTRAAADFIAELDN